ncbi:MAG: HupE/UreJ family protein [Verrucomicrobiales bacterium]
MPRLVLLALLAVAWGWVSPARGHEISALSVVADFGKNGSYGLTLNADVILKRDPEKFPEGVPEGPLSVDELADVEAQVRTYFEETLAFHVDGELLEPAFVVEQAGAAKEVARADENIAPSFEEPRPQQGAPPRRSYAALAKGELPAGAKEFVLEVSREATVPVIFIVFQDGKPTRHSQILYAGELARGVDLGAVRAGEALPRGGMRPPAVTAGGTTGIADSGTGGSESGALESAWRYLVLGYRHIVPMGLDHILFVLGLFLMSSRPGPLLWQITAFTVAHSITLALASLGAVNLPARVVEPVIALSIAFVALENIFGKGVSRWRIAVVFLFGLVHGLGFAGSLADWGLPPESLLPALVSFNIGVEAAQLTVILAAAIPLCWFWNRAWYRAVVVIPGSLLIAAVGLYWTWERIVP